MRLEYRSLSFGELEVRSETADGRRVGRGVAVPWRELSTPIGYDYHSRRVILERFERGAFADVLRSVDLDVICEWGHHTGRVVARTPETLALSETARGLEYRWEDIGTTAAGDLFRAIERRVVRGSSFEFAVDPDRKGEDWRFEDAEDSHGNAVVVRVVSRVAALVRVNPTEDPAYRGTEVEALQERGAVVAADLERWIGQSVDQQAAERSRILALAELAAWQAP